MQASEGVRFIVDKSDVIVVGADHETKQKWDRTAFMRQLLAAMSAIVGSVSFGMTTGFSGTLLPQLAKESLFVVDEGSESWIDGVREPSTVVLSMPLGVVIGAFSMRYLGRKKAQILIHLPWMAGWIVVSLATGFWTLLMGCALLGIGSGNCSVVSGVYVAETSEPRFRGLIAIQISVAVAFGIMLTHLQGIFLTWRLAVGLSGFFPLAAFVVIQFAPESPTWLALRGRVEMAKKTFMWLRNDALEAEDELNILISKATEYGHKEENIMKQIFSKNFLKPFFILNVMFVVQQGSGLNVLVFYAVKMFAAMHENIDAKASTITVDTVRLIAVLVSCWLIKKTGRRELYFISGLAALAALIGVIASVEFRLSDTTLVVFTCAYILFLYAGLSPIPWILVGELYPANLKEIGCCITNFSAFCIMFVVVKTGPFCMQHLGMTLMFSTYGIIVVVGMIFLYYSMPETNNITLQQVEENMKS